MAEIILESGAEQGRVIPLGLGVHRLGRSSKGGTIGLGAEFDTVSREHIEITVERDLVSVRDLGSANGTFVDGHKLTGQVEAVNGMRIELGAGPRRAVLTLRGVPDIAPADDDARAGAQEPAETTSPPSPADSSPSIIRTGFVDLVRLQDEAALLEAPAAEESPPPPAPEPIAAPVSPPAVRPPPPPSPPPRPPVRPLPDAPGQARAPFASYWSNIQGRSDVAAPAPGPAEMPPFGAPGGAGSPPPASPPPPPPPDSGHTSFLDVAAITEMQNQMMRESRRRRLLIAAAGLGVAILLVVLLILLWQ